MNALWVLLGFFAVFVPVLGGWLIFGGGLHDERLRVDDRDLRATDEAHHAAFGGSDD